MYEHIYVCVCVRHEGRNVFRERNCHAAAADVCDGRYIANQITRRFVIHLNMQIRIYEFIISDQFKKMLGFTIPMYIFNQRLHDAIISDNFFFNLLITIFIELYTE